MSSNIRREVSSIRELNQVVAAFQVLFGHKPALRIQSTVTDSKGELAFCGSGSGGGCLVTDIGTRYVTFKVDSETAKFHFADQDKGVIFDLV
jgi:hypothetical protein